MVRLPDHTLPCHLMLPFSRLVVYDDVLTQGLFAMARRLLRVQHQGLPVAVHGAAAAALPSPSVACQSGSAPVSPAPEHHHCGAVACVFFLAFEKRMNFSIETLSVEATGYSVLLSHLCLHPKHWMEGKGEPGLDFGTEVSAGASGTAGESADTGEAAAAAIQTLDSKTPREEHSKEMENDTTTLPCNETDSSSSFLCRCHLPKVYFAGRTVDLDFPQYVLSYQRVPELELWEIKRLR